MRVAMLAQGITPSLNFPPALGMFTPNNYRSRARWFQIHLHEFGHYFDNWCPLCRVFRTRRRRAQSETAARGSEVLAGPVLLRCTWRTRLFNATCLSEQ